MSKIIVPLHFAKLTTIPSSVEIGFKKFYLRGEWFKLYNGITEIDVVLDRPLDNYIPIPGTITSNDTVLTAIEKLDYAIGNINPNVLWGSITGPITAQTDLISYLSGNYVPVTRNITINGITYDLSTDRSWNITSMIYPSAGIAVSTGSAWGTSIVDNSTDWNTAYTNRITSLTTIGSGAATLISNVLNIPTPFIPTVGNWGALNYPTWVSGTPFVTMTAAGTFALDTTTYYPSSNPSGFVDSTYVSSNFYPLSSNPAGYLTQQEVLEYENLAAIQAAHPVGTLGTIYIALNTLTDNIPVYYVWNGVAYVTTAQPNTGITGSGTTNTIPVWTSPTTLGNSRYTQNPISGGGRYTGLTQWIDFTPSGSSVLSLFRAQSNISFSLGVANALISKILSSQNVEGLDLASAGDLILSAGGPANNPTNRLYINRTTGDIGIGTTSPVVRLDVRGKFRTEFAGDPGAGTALGGILAFAPSPFGLVFRGYSTGVISIQNEREANPSEVFAMSLQPTGANLLIGTITDVAGSKVQIVGNGNTSATNNLLLRNSSLANLLIVKNDGSIEIPQTPATGSISDKLLVRDSSGNVKQIDYPPAITIDANPTDGSSNAVSSNGVFDSLALKAPLASPTFTGTVGLPSGTVGYVESYNGIQLAIVNTFRTMYNY